MKFVRLDYEKEYLPLRKKMCEKYPMTFFPVSGKFKVPLKIGIFHDLRRDNPDIPKAVLSAFLKMYTSGPKYVKCMMYGADRIDLEGKRAGMVDKGHSAHALQRQRIQKQKRREFYAARKEAEQQRHQTGSI